MSIREEIFESLPCTFPDKPPSTYSNHPSTSSPNSNSARLRHRPRTHRIPTRRRPVSHNRRTPTNPTPAPLPPPLPRTNILTRDILPALPTNNPTNPPNRNRPNPLRRTRPPPAQCPPRCSPHLPLPRLRLSSLPFRPHHLPRPPILPREKRMARRELAARVVPNHPRGRARGCSRLRR